MPMKLKNDPDTLKTSKMTNKLYFWSFYKFQGKKNGRFLGFRGFFVILEILRYFDHFKGIVGGFYFLFFIF